MILCTPDEWQAIPVLLGREQSLETAPGSVEGRKYTLGSKSHIKGVGVTLRKVCLWRRFDGSRL